MIRIIAAIVFVLPICGIASAELSETDRIVDSLFLRASSAEIANQHMVEPSRQALVDMGLDAVPRLVTRLSTEDARERHAIANIFGRIGSPAVPALIEALDYDDIYTLTNASRCLGEIGDKEATPALLSLFDVDYYPLRSTAVTAVGKCHDSSAVSDCIRMLSDSVETVRKSAAVALGRIGHADASAALIDALDDDHFSVRMSAVRALADIGDEAGAELIERYDNLSDMARSLAFEVWAAVKYEKAAAILARAVKSEDGYMRGFAVVALALVNPTVCREIIDGDLTNETDPFVLSRIRDAELIIKK
jgi:HEAT repeat protein